MEKLRLKMDEVKAKGMFSLVVTVAKVVGPLIVLGLIILVLFPKQPENPAPVVVEKEVPVEVVKEVEKPVVQTVVVEKEVAVVLSPTLVSPTPEKPSCPMRAKLNSSGKIIICLRCYEGEGRQKCDYRVEGGMDGEGYYTVEREKLMVDITWWRPLAEADIK